MKHLAVLSLCILSVGCATTRTSSPIITDVSATASPPEEVAPEVAPEVEATPPTPPVPGVGVVPEAPELIPAVEVAAESTPVVEAAPEPAMESLLHPEAIETAMDCICGGSSSKSACMTSEKRRKRVIEGLVAITAIADEYNLPKYARPILAAVACGESGFNVRPTCGAETQCVESCMESKGIDLADMTPRQWHSCTTKCGGTTRCNDRGHSAGLFQFQWGAPLGVIARKRGIDLYSISEAGRFYIERLLNAVDPTRNRNEFKRLRNDCGRLRGAELWAVALKRLGKGPTLVQGSTSKVINIRTGEESLHVTKRIPQCQSSQYAEWAAQWSKRDPDVWLPQSRVATRD